MIRLYIINNYGGNTMTPAKVITKTLNVGVSNVDIKYQAGKSRITPLIGTWTTTIPRVGENQYLWIRTRTAYTNSSIIIAYSVDKIGTDEADVQLLYLSAPAKIMKFGSGGFVVQVLQNKGLKIDMFWCHIAS